MADYSNDYRISYGEASCAISFRCFDTPNSITLYNVNVPDRDAELLLIEACHRCLELHHLWSFSLPTSDVSRINAAAASERVGIDRCTARLLRAMQEFNVQEPTFDFTVGPVSYLWKHAQQVPDATDIAEVLLHVGAGKVRVGDDYAVKEDGAVKVDVGGAAKGFAADEIAELLRAAGMESADVDLGGNLYMVGSHPEGRAWRVSVRVPEGIEGSPIVLEVRDSSVVTSGSYERFVEIDGECYHHIIDARTGWPAICDAVSATVVGPSSLQADMLATTVLLEGSVGLPALRERHPDYTFVTIPSESGER